MQALQWKLLLARRLAAVLPVLKGVVWLPEPVLSCPAARSRPPGWAFAVRRPP